MRSTIITIILSIVAYSSEKWTTFEYPKYGFSIDMPSRPKESIKKIGDGVTHLFLYRTDNEAPLYTSYMVSYADLENKYQESDSASVTAYFEFVESKTMQTKPKAVLKKSNFNFKGHTGLEYILEYGDGAQTIILKYLLIKDKSYQLTLVCPTNTKDDPIHKMFFESFKLIDN